LVVRLCAVGSECASRAEANHLAVRVVLPSMNRIPACAWLIAVLAVGCNANAGGPQGEFAGEGWYQGRTHGHCTQLRYPTPRHEPVYVHLRLASTGRDSSGLAVNNDGTFGWYALPSTYFATLKPAHLYDLRASTVRVKITANGRVAFDLAYGRLK
jgi:hypothetical protein